MKRLFWPIIGLLLFYFPVAAQPTLGDYSQRGIASQEMKTQGFFAAHPSLPLDSKIVITNPRNNREVEVTVIDRIAPSMHRIIDLSFSAMEVLELKEGGMVILTVGAPAPVSRSSGYYDTIVDLNDPFALSSPVPQGNETTVNESAADINEAVVENINHENISEKKEVAFNGKNEFLVWLMAATLEARRVREEREGAEIREARDYRESREIREAREYRENREILDAIEAREDLDALDREAIRAARIQSEAVSEDMDWESIYIREALPVYPQPVQAAAIQIIPGLPDRNSGKIYRLQVGAYSASEAAGRAAESVKSAGFNVEREYTGSVYRVMAAGVASSDVYSASIRLGSAGFGQIWVRE